MDKKLITWPEQIFLQHGDEETPEFSAAHASGEITWCPDNITAADVRYIRADLAERASNPASPAMTAKIKPSSLLTDAELADPEYMRAYVDEIHDALGVVCATSTGASNPASPAPVAAITEHDDLSLKVLHAIYHACQRGGSAEQLHAAIMPDVRAALAAGAPQAQAEAVGKVIILMGRQYVEWSKGCPRLESGAPIYTTPPAAAAAPSVQEAKDAARWRAFRSRYSIALSAEEFVDQFDADADAVIDAAMSAAAPSTAATEG